jgi:hypothetical protein
MRSRFTLPSLSASALLLFFCINGKAQDTIDNDVEQKIENITETTNNEEADYTALIEQLAFFKEHPIDLNHTSKEELLDLGLLTEIQAGNLLEHIKKNGKLLNVYELQSIDGFDQQTIKKILPYITVAEDPKILSYSLHEMFRLGQHTLTFRTAQILEEQSGFAPIDTTALNNSTNSRYLGGPQKIYARYRFTYGTNVSWGITAEKDAGELFFTDQQKNHSHYYDSLLSGKQKNGFDFYSAHFFIRNVKFVKAFALGDYSVGFGQGLTCWSALAYTKGSEAMNIKKYGTGLRPYTSVDENRFFRGSAFTLGVKHVEFTGFFSRKKIDANIISFDTLNNEALIVSSLQQTGLHTTPSELIDRHAISETDLGGNLSYHSRKVSFGVTGISTLLSSDYSRSLDLYSQFAFSSKQITNVSADYNIVLHNFNFFGEGAISLTPGQALSGGKAMINGVLIAADQRFSFSVLHRYFERNYRTLFANAFGESTEPANEQGIYIGTTIKPTDFITINAFYDRFVFPWLRYQVDAPSHGEDWMAQINYTPSKKLDMYFRIRQRDKFTNFNEPDELDYLMPTAQTNYRYHISYAISNTIKFRNRIEFLQWDDGTSKEKGFMLYQDVILKIPKTHITLTGRYALFDTDGYNSRLYVYESDIPGSYSIPSYYYRGSRTYLMIDYDITRKLELWVRWGQIYYSNKNVISEGSLTQINGNTKTEVKAQVRWKF